MASDAFAAALQIKHDVFINFRGKDTRNNFTSHLQAALERNGINTFTDKGLKGGEEISTTLSKKISESQASVVIFSPNYASSRWCLVELARIMQCMELGQTVLPVFLQGVKPTHVRNQTGAFGNAFGRLLQEARFMDKVEIWRRALKQAADLTGWASNKISESDIVEKILSRIQSVLGHKSSHDSHRQFFGIEYEEEVELIVHSRKIRCLGIWGIADGKTYGTQDGKSMVVEGRASLLKRSEKRKCASDDAEALPSHRSRKRCKADHQQGTMNASDFSSKFECDREKRKRGHGDEEQPNAKKFADPLAELFGQDPRLQTSANNPFGVFEEQSFLAQGNLDSPDSVVAAASTPPSSEYQNGFRSLEFADSSPVDLNVKMEENLGALAFLVDGIHQMEIRPWTTPESGSLGSNGLPDQVDQTDYRQWMIQCEVYGQTGLQGVEPPRVRNQTDTRWLETRQKRMLGARHRMGFERIGICALSSISPTRLGLAAQTAMGLSATFEDFQLHLSSSARASSYLPLKSWNK